MIQKYSHYSQWIELTFIHWVCFYSVLSKLIQLVGATMYHKKEIQGLLWRDGHNLMVEGRQVYNYNAIKRMQLER